MKRRVSLLAVIASLLFATSQQPRAISNSIVISQIYGGGGNTGSTYTNDFIELFNRSASPVDVTGMSVQYSSAAGTTWQVTNLSGTIAPGGYYLVQEAVGTGGTTNLPTPDATGTIAMSATAGKVALVGNTTALAGACPVGGTIIDFLGFGPTATCFEAAPTAGLSNTTAALRAANGCTETDNNATDFSCSRRCRATAQRRPPLRAARRTHRAPAPRAPRLCGRGSLRCLTVAVTPGSSPASTGLTVNADLSAIGGAATQTFLDNGLGGDAVAGDNVFSFQATVSAATTPGAKSLPATIADARGADRQRVDPADGRVAAARVRPHQRHSGPGRRVAVRGLRRPDTGHRHGAPLERVLPAIGAR